ncbi:tetratricopeptide repeat protein [Oryzomonas japonica]|uniref:Tetratricopeptide repeat protein n=1 Tax=Oryzomonas japonica TaxID=2603858 RepID=A0A7J4ZTD4_9BACT|nr:tetratricopeptide repeat protein [Oryzomonas japonica]KAB0666475.1 tetratricopeptide repeat protein [Oryzomonas japonica]
MQQGSGSFWTEIKAYEERLAANPDSFCFARLAEIYLKVGLTDDALHVARKGVAQHPGHVAGQRALALACHAKGLTDECRSALEQVVAAMPEDRDSLKLLGRLYAGSGNEQAAIRVLNTVLDLNPDDEECRIELEAIGHAARGFSPAVVTPVAQPEHQDAEFTSFDDEEEIIEDLEVLELDESDLVEEMPADDAEESEQAAAAHHDPLSTTTLAELYVQQGFVSKALAIYQTILADDPANRVALARVAELSAAGASQAEPWDDTAPAPPDDGDQAEYGDSDEVRFEPPPAASAVADTGLQPRGEADNALETLEGWLENIRRIKACR